MKEVVEEKKKSPKKRRIATAINKDASDQQLNLETEFIDWIPQSNLSKKEINELNKKYGY